MTKVVIFSVWEIGPNVSYMWRLVVNKFKLSVNLLPINTKSLWQEEHSHFGALFPLNSNVIIIYTINNVGIFLLVIYFLKTIHCIIFSLSHNTLSSKFHLFKYFYLPLGKSERLLPNQQLFKTNHFYSSLSVELRFTLSHSSLSRK